MEGRKGKPGKQAKSYTCTLSRTLEHASQSSAASNSELPPGDPCAYAALQWLLPRATVPCSRACVFLW